MIPTGTRIWIVAGVTDLRRGFIGLSAMVQTTLKENPFSGQVFIFRGRRGDLISCCGTTAMVGAAQRPGIPAGNRPVVITLDQAPGPTDEIVLFA